MTTLRQLKDLGVRIAMDDFGTGYSSLGYLQKFPFDKIKIDKSFVSALETRADADAIVRAVVELGRSLGMLTCAEGVETAEQLTFLESEGCDEVQGYYFGRPMTASDFERMLELMAKRPQFASAGRPRTRDIKVACEFLVFVCAGPPLGEPAQSARAARQAFDPI